jgi:rhodanese-related sulfurtransferase
MALKKGAMQLVAEAEAEIETISAEDAKGLVNDENTVIVDLRDIRELWNVGTIPGSLHAPRGMLEFWVDPESPYHREVFASGKKLVFFCAGGLRSALAAKVVQDMGVTPVAHIAGGFGAWTEAEGPIEVKEKK